MKNVVIITSISLVLSLVVCKSNAQTYPDYLPIEFSNLNPVWQHLCSDSTLYQFEDYDFNTVVDFTGTNHFVHETVEWPHALIQDGYLYSVSEIRFDTEYGGGLLEKIDLETGDRLWKSSFDLRTTSLREVILKSFIEEDKLVVACVEVQTPDLNVVAGLTFFPFLYVDGSLLIRKYDLETGELLYKSVPDTSNVDRVNLPVNSNRRTQLRYIGNNRYVSYTYRIKNNKYPIYVDTILETGVKVNPTDSLYGFFDGPECVNHGTLQYTTYYSTEEGLYKIERCNPLNEGDWPSKVRLKYFVHNELEPLWVKEFGPYNAEIFGGMRILNYIDDQIILKSWNINGPDTGVMCFNSEGEKTCDIQAQDFRFARVYDFSDEQDGKFLISSLNTYFEDADKKLYISQIDGAETSVYDSLEIVGEEVKILLNMAVPLDDDHYLLDISFGPVNMQHRTWMKVRSDDLLQLTTSTTEYSSTDLRSFKIYPNPVMSTLSIISPQEMKVVLVDGLGKNILDLELHKGHNSFKLDGLQAGVYWIRALNYKSEPAKLIKI